MKLKRRNFEQKEIVTIQPKYDLSKLHPDRAADGGSAEARRHGFIDTSRGHSGQTFGTASRVIRVQARPEPRQWPHSPNQ